MSSFFILFYSIQRHRYRCRVCHSLIEAVAYRHDLDSEHGYVVPTFFLLFSLTFLFEDFYYSVKDYRKISVCCSSG